MIVATGAEGILGIGDWGVGGIDIAIGKLVVCTAAAGINPARVIPVMLDVGTNRDSLLKDPLYIGNRHSRVRGEPYDHFIDEYVNTATRLFPNALLHWEDFGPGNARSILEKYRTRICTFNDDMQGTGAITLAAILSAISITHIPLREQRIVIFGSGTVGIGNADQIRSAMMIEGLPQDEATRNFWCIDIQGLLTTDMGNTLGDFQVPYARPTSEVATWQHDLPGGNQSILNYRVKREKHSDSAIMCTMLATSWSESVLYLSGSFYLNREEHHTLSVNLLIPSRLKRS